MTLPDCVRKALLYCPMSAQELLDSLQSPHKELELRPQLEAILRRIPTKWDDYRKSAKQHRGMLAEGMGLLPPKGRAGAPRKDEQAEQATLLQQRGMTYPQIAAELNKTLGKEKQTTPDAIRKLLK